LLALRPRGRLVSCGSTTGAAATFDLPHAYHAGIRILGADSYAAVELAAMLDHCWTRGFEAVVDATFPLAELADAQRRLESGVVGGKVLVTP
jgi:NADPH:quinone reductase-like Zn-dependent oxidoreductase